MALSGIQIYKYLPKTNCKKCGFPTCLAFAMKLARGEVDLSLCPELSREARVILEAASRPPMRQVAIGSGKAKLEVGNEEVLFRHERSFRHRPGLMLRVRDTAPHSFISRLVAEVSQYKVERIGLELRPDGIAIQNDSRDADAFARCIRLAESQADLPLVLISTEPEVMRRGLDEVKGKRPLVYAAREENWHQMAELALEYRCPLAVYEPRGLAELATLVKKVNSEGVEDMVLDPGGRGFAPSLELLTQVRRLALEEHFRPLGYPVIAFPGEEVETEEEEALLAAQHILKYAGIIVMDHFSPTVAYPLLTLRLNIYSDPREPMQVASGIYPLGNPGRNSPLLATTNFSLTYFSVAGEVDSGGFPAWLLVCDTEGLSVLTAWAAGKFNAEKIARTLRESEASERIEHRSLIIPGMVAILRGELEEEMPGWKIMVGPPEAMEIGSYLKRFWRN
jgi:acetyl-CoA decarbonylase/synthase complex subunit gamma